MISLAIATFLLGGVLSHEGCGFHAVQQKELAEDPSYQSRLDKMEDHCKSERHIHRLHAMERNGKARRGLQDGIFDGKGFSTSEYFNGILEIPVVVHVMYNPNFRINLDTIMTQERIQSQIRRLNMDYLSQNEDTISGVTGFAGYKANYQMSFKLHQVIRKPVSWGEYDLSDRQHFDKSVTVDPVHHLNIYVLVGLNSNGDGGMTLGNCLFPGVQASRDGCTINYKVFGDASAEYIDNTWKNDLGIPNGAQRYRDYHGRTTTHEIGHYFYLIHTWGDKSESFDWRQQDCYDGDNVGDTPNQQGPHNGCPNTNSEFIYSSCGTYDMYMNFMDYSDGECKTMFSKGQLERTLSVLNQPYGYGRKELVDYQYASEYSQGRFVNDLYFAVVSSSETQESRICGPTDRLINFTGKVSDDKTAHACVSTTNNKYVNVITDMFRSNGRSYGYDCVKTLGTEYLCYSKGSFTSSSRMTPAQVEQKLFDIFNVQ